MYWQANLDAAMSLMKEAHEQGAPAFLCTVRGSVHISQSDFSLLYPHICSVFLKATVNPKRAIDLNIRYICLYCPYQHSLTASSASLEFLRDVTEGAGKSIIERCLTDEKLLQTGLLETMPDEHKPESEWIGGKLRVPHEFRTRLLGKVQRKMKRKRKGNLYNSGDEMWMHFKPDADELLDWRLKHSCINRAIDRENEPDVERSSDEGKIIRLELATNHRRHG